MFSPVARWHRSKSTFNYFLIIHLLAASTTLFFGGSASTQERCDPQPSDSQKLSKAVAHYLASNPSLRPFKFIEGELQQVEGELWTDPAEAISAQPGCCSIAYEDAETFKAPALKEQLGNNFGGFAYVSFDYVAYHDDRLRIFRSFRSYVLNSCGDPIMTMSED